MSSLQVKVSNRTKEGSQYFEATARIPGVRPTKLVRRSDGSTKFPSRSAVLTSARSLARRLGFTDGVDTGTTTTTKKTTSKKATGKKATGKKTTRRTTATTR